MRLPGMTPGHNDPRITSYNVCYTKLLRGPGAVLGRIRKQAQACRDDNIWIHLLSESETEPYLESLARHDAGDLPLYGIPFATASAEPELDRNNFV